MTALVVSQSRQRSAHTRNVKVTCSHRQKPHQRKPQAVNTFTVSICLVITKQQSEDRYQSEIIRTATRPSRKKKHNMGCILQDEKPVGSG